MSNIDNDITEVVETLLEKAWVKYQQGDALGGQKIALQAYRLQPEIETNPNVSPYLDQMFANYDEREHATLDLTWRDTLFNFVKIGVGIVLITFVLSILANALFIQFFTTHSDQFNKLFDQIIVNSQLPTTSTQQIRTLPTNLGLDTSVFNLFANAISSAIGLCISLFIRDGVFDIVATRILKGKGSIHRFVHKSVRYEVISFLISSILAIVLGFILLNALFLPLLSNVGATTTLQPMTTGIGSLVVILIIAAFLGWFIGQAAWLAHIIAKTYQFGWGKGCLTQIIPVVFVFGTFFCLCGVIPSILVQISAR